MIGGAALLLVLTIWGILSRYRRAAPNEMLVVYGKAGHMKDKDGKKILTPSKIIQGGGTFVWPIIQAWKKMSMAPIQMKVPVEGIDSQAIPMQLPVVLTTAISRDKMTQFNAATRFLSTPQNEIQKQIQEILVGETRAIMATMPIERINADRTEFLNKVRESLEIELKKVGFEVTNINISEITDSSNYIVNLGKKAATAARVNAEADIAEQTKQGAIKIANTKKEEDIAVAQAERDKQINVNKALQQQEVEVAEITREKEINLAKAAKERESGIAEQEAEKIANVAKAQSDAESKKAEFEALQTKNIAKAAADAEAAQNEAEQDKQARIIKANQEREAKTAEYESNKRQRKAEQDKLAGVAEQEAKIDVAKARAKAGQAEADAIKIAETAKVEAELSVAKTKQERQLEVNKAMAKANEEQLNATEIIVANKAKEKAIIEAEAIKKRTELEAEATKAKILREAEAEAEAIRIRKNAEAEGDKNKALAEAEGKRASLMAEAEALQQKELAPAMAFERMIQAAGSPEMAVQWKMADKWEGIAGAQANALSRINLGHVTVYGDKNTGAQFAKSLIENLAPALDMINSGVKGQFKDVFGKKSETPTPAAIETKPEPKQDDEELDIEDNFEDVK